MDAISKLGLNSLDFVIIAVVAWGLVRGLREGFVSLLLSIIGMVLGFWCAATWSSAVVSLLEAKVKAVSVVANWTRQYISVPVELASQQLKSVNPAEIVKRILALPLSQDMKTILSAYVSSMLANMGGLSAATVGEYLYKGFASLILQAVSFLIILYLVRGIAVILSDVLTHFVISGSITSMTNRVLGAAFGAIQYGIILVAVVGLMTPIAHLASNTSLGQLFAASRLAGPLAETFFWAVTALGGGF